MTFNGRTAILTGGTDGIGLHLARKLADAGTDLLIIGRRAKEECTLPEGAEYLQVDLSKEEPSDKIARHIGARGWDRLDYLIHNAGMGYVGPIHDETVETCTQIIQTNLLAPMGLTHAMASLLEKTNGTVCFIGSTAAGRATPDFATYTATKTALADFARNLRTEWAGRIKVIEVHPGPTRTGFHSKSGMADSPIMRFFMAPETVAEGIMTSLSKGKAKRKFGLISMVTDFVTRPRKKNAQ